MVRLGMATAAIWGAMVLPGPEAAAQAPRPKAEQVLSGLERSLPGYKLPWQLDKKIRRFRSEQEWRSENPGFIPRARQMIAGLQQIPDKMWQEQVRQMQPLLEKMKAVNINLGDMAATSPDPLMPVFAEAVRNSASKQEIARLLEERLQQLRDEAMVQLAKVERPDLLAKGDESRGAASFTITLEIWNADSLRRNVDEIDLAGPRLDALAESTRKNLQATLDLITPMAAREAEERLAELYSYQRPDEYAESIADEIEKLNSLAACTFSVKTDRPAVGSAAYVLLIGGRDPERSRPVVQATAQVRRGTAVFKLAFTAANSYASDEGLKDLDKVLKLLADRAAPFDLPNAAP